MEYIIHPTKDYLAHSAKGTTWKNHKYIRKEGNRYIYDPKDKKKFEEDLEKYKDEYEADRNNRINRGNLINVPSTEGALKYERASHALAAMKIADKANNKNLHKMYDSYSKKVDDNNISTHLSIAERDDKRLNKKNKKK